MSDLSRRQFLAAATAAAALPLSARTLKTIGVQLYTVRSVFPKKPLEILKALEQIGYREVEVTGDQADPVWANIGQTSLKPISLHLDTALFTTSQDKLGPALDNAKAHGLKYVVCPYIMPKDRGGADVMKKLGETLAKAGEKCAERGIVLCYHNHAFEFAPAGSSTLLDVLLEAADPKLLSLELDMMWAQVAGVNPVSVLEKHGSRVKLMHLKDVTAMPKRYNEEIPAKAFREVGNGVINVGAVLAAAEKAGVEHFFVEQDQTPGDPLASLRQSYVYLAKLDY